MKLHANAALSLSKRARLLCGVVRRAGWTLRRRPRPPGQRALRGSGWVATARGRECGLLDRSSAPRRSPTAPRAAGRRRSPRCAGCGSPGRRSLRLLGMPLSTVSGILTRIGMGQLGRLGLEPADRYERARPGELIHIDVKKLGRIAAAPAIACCGRQQRRRPSPPRRTQQRLGVRARRDRRLHPPGLRRSPARREGHHRDRLPAPRRRVLPPPRHHRRAR